MSTTYSTCEVIFWRQADLENIYWNRAEGWHRQKIILAGFIHERSNQTGLAPRSVSAGVPVMWFWNFDFEEWSTKIQGFQAESRGGVRFEDYSLILQKL